MNQLQYQMELICIALYSIYNGNRELARHWLDTSKSELGGYTPLALIRQGAIAPVLSLLVTTIKQ